MMNRSCFGLLLRTVLGPLCGIALMMASTVQAADLVVSVFIEGIENKELRQELAALHSFGKNKGPYTAVASIERAAERNRTAMRQALISKGYYAAKINFDVRRIAQDVTLTFEVAPGALFAISDYQIDYRDEQPSPRPTTLREMNIRTRGLPTGDALKTTEDKVLQWLWNNGYPSAQSIGRRVDAKYAAGTAVAVFPIVTGPKATYGEVTVSGLEKTDPNYVRAMRPFDRGDIYRRSDIDTYRNRLAETGLFRSILIQPGPPDMDGVTDLIIEITERKHRTFGFGVSFGTDVGVGTTAYWENRNLFGSGERFRTALEYSSPEQTLEVTFVKPVPRWPGQWRLSALFENENTEAYEAQTGTLGTGLSYLVWNNDLELTAGVEYQFADITETNGTEETFSSFAFPLSATFNNENDVLNPTRGVRARVAVTPFIGNTQFNKIEVGGASRLGFGSSRRTLIAGRVLVGGILGASQTDVPATERFYAGGGGSIRGYGYQEAGPLDPLTGDPIGGASLFEVNVEARHRIGKSWQVALFADGGTISDNEVPDFEEDMLVGAGLGVRYFTPIGPVRLDVATPLDRRTIDLDGERIFEDAAVQVYIALGQPF